MRKIVFTFAALLIMFGLLTPGMSFAKVKRHSSGHTKSQSKSGIAPRGTDSGVQEKVNRLVQKMTLQEKIDMVHGISKDGHTGYVPANKRLGIPALKLTDGPGGVRQGDTTAFPAPLGLGATWDKKLASKYGTAVAEESLAKNQNDILGPTINILRLPQWGRSFETFGEDPYLTSQLAVPWIKGSQDNGVIATAKHFVVNTQEYNRGSVNSKVSKRALNEIYFPAFKASVQQAHVGSVMSSYNKVNGTYASENDYILNRVLKQRWGFDGFVVSDWGGTHSTVAAANHGLDLEMPGDTYFGQALKEAVQKGQVSETRLDNMVSRILTSMYEEGLFDSSHPEGNLDHADLARKVAEQGTVLLKNKDNLLPLNKEQLQSIAVIGPYAKDPKISGGGSAHITPTYSVSPLEGIKKQVGDNVDVRFSKGINLDGSLPVVDSSALTPSGGEENQHGLKAEYFNNMEMKGDPVLTRVDDQVDFNWGNGSPANNINNDKFSVRWTGKVKATATGTYAFSLTSDDGSRMYINDELVVDNWGNHAAETKKGTIQLEAGKDYDIKVEYYDNGQDASVSLGWKKLQLVDPSVLTPSGGEGKQHGLKAEYFNNMEMKGDPVLTRVDDQIDFDWGTGAPADTVNNDKFSVRWTGKLKAPSTGTYTFRLTSDDGSRLYINDEAVIDNWGDHAAQTKEGTIQLEAGQDYDIKVEYYDNAKDASVRLGWEKPGQSPIGKAAKVAEGSDAAVVVVADNRSEGSDRDTLELPSNQDALIQAVAKANPHTIVVMDTGGPTLMNKWIDDVDGALEAWYPGQENGHALANILFGKVNPSGKLPMTIQKHAGDESTAEDYPGDGKTAGFSDDIFVGYRHFDENNIKPQFAFGYGLSYTTFAYDNLSISKASKGQGRQVGFDVTNTGSRAGAEVPQLYLGIPGTNVKEPPKQLKGFEKVNLEPGETKHITFQLNKDDLSYWNTDAKQWMVQKGQYKVMVGSSSRNIHLQGSFELTTNAKQMKELVRDFEEKGAFANQEAVHALLMHLTAVSHYEEKGATDKVVKHLKGFEVLLDHQKNNELISEEAYQTLKGDADYLMKKYQKD